MKVLLGHRFSWRLFLFLVALCAGSSSVHAAPPVLLSRANSTRAVALESLNLQREPFAVNSSSVLGNQDTRTRILLFALNLSGADASQVTVDAEDGNHRHYNFKVEHIGPLPGAEAAGISQLTVRFSDDLTVVGDLLVEIKYGGLVSNRVRVGIGYIGDGLPDDFIKISGRVSTGVTGLAGVLVMLTGSLNAPTVTDGAGYYSFTNVVPGGNYQVSASRINYTLSPVTHNLPFLVADQIANFSATAVNFTISGRITNEGRPLSGITVNLSGSQSGTSVSDADGRYSLNAAAEGNYLVTATSGIYTFGPSSAFFANLNSNQMLDFAVTARPTWSISGFVKNTNGTPLPGVTLTLSGGQAATVLTDSTGFYGFANISAAGTYSVTASRLGYSFSPTKQDFPSLSANQTANFTAAPNNYTISGSVTDANGTGVANVSVMLSGSQSATTITTANGSYSFTVVGLGSYAITPSSNFNSFTPAIQTFDNLGGDRTANFTAIDFLGLHTLEFDGNPKTVDYGDFFQLQPGQTELGKFFWEFWAMPGTNSYARYMLSDGYGGAHALLFGFVGDFHGTRYSLYGNVWNGVTAIDFGSDDGPAANEWGHMAVGWDGTYLYTYFNGVPVGLKAFSGPRLPAGSNNGGGRLFIGGSDHNNFHGRIEQVRGFENANPRDNGRQTVTFQPDTLFGMTPGTSLGPRSTFLTNFFRPTLTVPDFAGGRVGTLRAGWPVTSPISTYPLPQFVIDPSAPNSSPLTGPRTPTGTIETPTAAPDRAIVFDSFSRETSTYAFNGRGGLGSTEGGTEGRKEWKSALVTGDSASSHKPFGILNGRAVLLSDFQNGALAWIEVGSTSGVIFTTVSRDARLYKTGLDTGIAFRVVDSANFFFAATYGDRLTATNRKLQVGYWLNGRINYLLVNAQMPESWVRLRVVTTAAGHIDIYADETLIYSVDNSLMANAKGVGLFNPSHDAMARWENFTVYDLP